MFDFIYPLVGLTVLSYSLLLMAVLSKDFGDDPVISEKADLAILSPLIIMSSGLLFYGGFCICTEIGKSIIDKLL